jgi:hypothetical protein
VALAQLAGSSIVGGALTAQGVAGAVAVLALLAAARPWRGRTASVAPWGAPLALTAAFATGYLLILGAPGFPPTSARGWLFLAAAGTGLLGLAMALSARPLRVLGAIASALLPWFLLGFQREHHWSRGEGIAWTVGLALWAFAGLETVRASERRSRNAAGTFGLAVGLALAAGAYGIAGSASFAQLGGILALAVGGCAVLGAWHRVSGLGPAAAPALAHLHLGLVWCCRYLAELHTTSFVLLSLVPLAALPAGLPDSRPRLRAVLAVVIPLALGAAALWIEVAGAPPPSRYG